MPESRPADYYLGCLDGCIFIDFNECPNGNIQLVRISFDGFGCCELDGKVKPINQVDSATFREILKSDAPDLNLLEPIIKRTVQENRGLIPEEALREYDLY